MMPNATQGVNSNSPSAQALFTPSNMLGLDSATPGGGGLISTPLYAALMGRTESEFRFAVRACRHDEEQERRDKLRRVLKSIGRPFGRVSEEGIARLAHRVGFETDLDNNRLSPEQRQRKVGNQEFSIAGRNVLIFLGLKDHVPCRAGVEYGVPELEKASRVLYQNLQPPDGNRLNFFLDTFASNLQLLARIDRPQEKDRGVNGWEAINGVYAALTGLYEREKQQILDMLDPSSPDVSTRAAFKVLRKRSGLPVMHSGGKLGLALNYWRSRRPAPTHDDTQDTKTEADSESQDETTLTQDGEAVFALRFETEECDLKTPYLALRVSEAWLPQTWTLPELGSLEGIPWQEPDAVDLNASELKFAPLGFVVKFEPPLVVPYQTAVNIRALVGLDTPLIDADTPLYFALLVNPAGPVPAAQSMMVHTNVTRRVLSFRSGRETTVYHRYALNSAKADYGFQIDSLPFSHPRQLVELLPTLRQWASVGSLLRDIFVGAERSDHGGDGEESFQAPLAERSPNRTPSLAELLAVSHPVHPEPDQLPVSIAFSATPVPTLGLGFPLACDGRITRLEVQVGPNADITVEDLMKEEDPMRLSTLGRAFDLCADVGVWVEYVRRQRRSPRLPLCD